MSQSADCIKLHAVQLIWQTIVFFSKSVTPSFFFCDTIEPWNNLPGKIQFIQLSTCTSVVMTKALALGFICDISRHQTNILELFIQLTVFLVTESLQTLGNKQKVLLIISTICRYKYQIDVKRILFHCFQRWKLTFNSEWMFSRVDNLMKVDFLNKEGGGVKRGLLNKERRWKGNI